MRFRIWDGETMVYPEDQEFIYAHSCGSIVRFESTGHCDGKGDPDYQMIYDGAEYTSMLSTGRKDVGGKEIYDGDKIRGVVDDQIIEGAVFWDDERLTWRIKGFVSYELRHVYSKHVIGNIHENPELAVA